MKVNLLVCDWFEGLLPDFVKSFPDMFQALFDSVAESDVTYRIYDVIRKMEFPQELKSDELYVITGSMSGAYDRTAWVLALQDFIRTAHARQMKMAGICFGHQVIAQALGGRVEPSPKGWGVGIRTSRLVHPQASAYFPEGELRLFYNHNDQVVLLPPGASRIATSEFCENEAYLIGNHVLCFQGHPEYTAPYEKHVLDINPNASPEVLKRGYETTAQDNAMGKEAARWMLDLIRR